MNRTKIDYLFNRIKLGHGNKAVLIAELVKTFNRRPMRRGDDQRVQGWTLIQSAS